MQPGAYRRHRFPVRYTGVDIEQLASVDEAHQTLSGPATQKILGARLGMSFANRDMNAWRGCRWRNCTGCGRAASTGSAALLIKPRDLPKWRSENRRRPDPQGRPGYLRVDTVHQGDQGRRIKGLYHINAVDEVTQWEVVGATAQISEAWLMPVLEAMLAQFPFPIRGFHSDNGSEFIKYNVAGLLNKLLVEQTKSHPHHSNDNGLAETKNGWVIRKHIGYGHINSAHAEAFDQFYREHFNPYLNFHRPCAVPEEQVTAKGKVKRVYRWYATPWEVLRQLPGLGGFLRGDLDGGSTPESGSGEIGHSGGGGNAGSQGKAVGKFVRKAQRMKGTGRAMEMTGAWKTRKTNGRFSIVFPSPWKWLHDPHVPTAPARRGKVENRKQVSHFPSLRS